MADDTRDDRWLRERISQILEHGWSIEELEEIGITRSILARLGFRDDHPRLFDPPKPLPRKKAASRNSRDAASALYSVRMCLSVSRPAAGG